MTGKILINKGGLPKHIRTEEIAREVQEMAGFAMAQEMIAKVKGISKPTLRKYYKPELEAGMAVALATVSRALFINATVKMNVTAQIFFLKNRAPDIWKDVQQHEGKIEGAIAHLHAYKDLDKLSDTEIATIYSEATRIDPESNKGRRFTKA